MCLVPVLGSLRWAEEARGMDTPAASGRRTRRRRANVEGGRPFSHLVRVSVEEEAMLIARAAQRRVSVPRLLVEAALSDSPRLQGAEREDVAEALFGMQRVLAGLGNNLNQIARVMNAGGDVEAAQLAAVVARLRSLAMRIEEALGRV